MSITVRKVSPAAFLASVALLYGCNNTEPQAPPPPPQAQAPQPPVVVPPAMTQQATPPTPPPPPATPLIPVGDAEETQAAPTPSKPRGVKSGDIDKALGGAATSGDELVGPYACQIHSKKLQLGPIKLPPFGCRIFRAANGELKISSTSDAAASFKGSIENNTAAGFFIAAKYEMAGNNLAVKAKMKRTGGDSFSGDGRGRLNDDKSSQISYKLTMNKK